MKNRSFIYILSAVFGISMMGTVCFAETAMTVEKEKVHLAAQKVMDESGLYTKEDTEEKEMTDAAVSVLEDGTYSAVFDTDSSMFHVNESCDGISTLTVEDGNMVIHVSLTSKNIVNLFPGTAEDAEKEGAVWLEPTEDTVTYSDGWTEVVYGFDVPVSVLDEEFDLALLGKKGKWYDHKVSVSLKES